MPINFFDAGCKTESKKLVFGLCDDIPNSKAYIDEADTNKWIAIVKNPDSKKAEFIAIDNCVELRRADNSMESRCDGVLKESTNLFFVELKERGSKNWFGDGRKQLTNTVRLFKANHDHTSFTNVTAYVCNKLKPYSHSGRAISIQMFKDDTGYELFDKNEIEI